ncbi:two-component system, NarL family, response regulator DegU [Candidatus Gastranaerophilus sp. (ex Termes propinquus)]|nr:two-component system, NarL family, response regulator DegU [Candidatus Gastranaerophilus sp. (ex Termes propinquus)]
MRRGEFKRKFRVIVCDDNYDHASGIRELINLENDYEVIANAANVNVALSLIKKYQPDIVLMDINMPEIDGITGISEVEKLGLGTKIIALTGYDDADLIYRSMKLGAKGYILKTMASAQLIHALDEVSAGKVYLPNSLSSKFFEYFQGAEKQGGGFDAGEDEENLLNFLTNREEEVLELLTKGITYKGVATKLFISETTVKTHVNNIFQKLQVNDRTQAVLYAINKGFSNRKRVKIAV